jgi:hypothetical protein
MAQEELSAAYPDVKVHRVTPLAYMAACLASYLEQTCCQKEAATCLPAYTYCHLLLA